MSILKWNNNNPCSDRHKLQSHSTLYLLHKGKSQKRKKLPPIHSREDDPSKHQIDNPPKKKPPGQSWSIPQRFAAYNQSFSFFPFKVMLGGATSLRLACYAVDGQCQGEEDNQVPCCSQRFRLRWDFRRMQRTTVKESMSFADFDHVSSFLPAKLALQPKTCVPKGRRAFIEELHCRKRFVCGFSSLLWPSKWDLIC
jgi:hypothetical protein